MTPRGDQLEYAILYGQRGIPVFPLHPRSKIPRIEGWPDLATCDEETLVSWYQDQGPDGLNIGIRTGTGIIVLDVDPRHHGDAALLELEERFGPLPRTPEVKTGDGGRHLYFNEPPGIVLRNSQGKLGSGLDIKAARGFAVSPPSIHPNGT